MSVCIECEGVCLVRSVMTLTSAAAPPGTMLLI